MKRTQKKLLISFALLSTILLSTGCAPKNSNGTYASAYSYHSYVKKNHSTEQTTRVQPYQRTYIRPANIQMSHIYSSYQPTNNISTSIERTAKSLLGTDYQYGANGPYQYDCSSFTKYVFSKQGINLPRVSREQAKQGQFITANQLQKGDLIFFDSKKSNQVSHVGIYLGGGNFIHASSAKDKVTISNLSSNYYSKHFKWGRRVTNLNYAMK